MVKRAQVAVALVVTMAVSAVLPSASVFAAEQTITIPTVAAADDPMVPSPSGDALASTVGVNLKAPLNDAATQVDSAAAMGGLPTGYTWRVTVPATLCEGAQIKSLRVRTNTTADVDDAGSGVVVATYPIASGVINTNYGVNGGLGEDMNTWMPALSGAPTPAIDRGSEAGGMFWPANLGLAGQLDGTWDISGAQPGDQFGIFVEHLFFGAATEGVQTTIESAQIIYDDANCAIAVDTTPDNEGSNPVPTLPDTGDSMFVPAIFSIALLLAAGMIFRISRP